jgi:hypothetical protein
MPKTLYLINPACDHPLYYSAEVYVDNGYKAATQVADLSTPTLAALAPPGIDTIICDENISPVDFESNADFIGITGKVTQFGRMLAIAREFRRSNKLVIIGGPYASLSPERVRGECDVLVQGEFEDLAAEFFSDMLSSSLKAEYFGGKSDLSKQLVPKWSKYPNDRALIGTLQTSRGCPFECEFCDVIQYLGRKQRHKPVNNVLAELDELYSHGYRGVFLADDNLTVYKSRARELLLGLRQWNEAQVDGKVSFNTQVSIEISKDSAMLNLCAEAGLKNVFIGIETPNEASLKETKKRQNVGVNLGDQIREFVSRGMTVTAGMIVGFDSDTKDIFERQFEFAMSVPVPLFTTGALVAPLATPLYARLQAENRLIENRAETAASPWSTNILPVGMTRGELLSGLKWLCNRLYRPQSFGDRMLSLISELPPIKGGSSPARRRSFRSVDLDTLALVGKISSLGPEEKRMIERIMTATSRKPGVSEPFIIPLLAQYMQYRHMFNLTKVWDPLLGASKYPPMTPVYEEVSSVRFVERPVFSVLR